MSPSAPNVSSHAVGELLDALPLACCIHSKTRIEYANPALARLFEEGALAGRHSAALLHPAFRARFEGRVSRLLAGEAVGPEEHDLLGPGSRPIRVSIASSIIPYDGQSAVLSFFIPLEGESRFRRLVDANLIGVIEVGPDGILTANDAFLKTVGRARDEFDRDGLRWSDLTPPEYAQVEREKLRALLATGECQPFERQCVRPDGSRAPVLVCCTLVAPEPDWRTICFVIDLTERQNLEEARAEKMRLESVGVLAAGMAHNLNNLLTAIIGNAGLLLDQHMLPADSPAAAIVQEIIQSGDRAAALTSQLLAYAGRGRFVVAPTDVRAMIETHIAMMRAEMPENVALTVHLEDRLPVIVADPNQLRDIVTGLVINAVEAIGCRDRGGITVEARVEQVAAGAVISPAGEALRPGEYCVIEVRDNGSGMDPKTLAHAFDPFFSTKFPGRGLGLAAIAGIVRTARGVIRVRSSPGQGSVFQVYLPEGREEQARASPHQ